MGQQIPCKESLNDHCFSSENCSSWKQLYSYTIFGEHQIHTVKLRKVGAGQDEEGYRMFFASICAERASRELNLCEHEQW